jgi:hypothetical protein
MAEGVNLTKRKIENEIRNERYVNILKINSKYLL